MVKFLAEGLEMTLAFTAAGFDYLGGVKS